MTSFDLRVTILFFLFSSEDKLANTTSKKKAKKLNLDVEVQPDNGKDSSRKEGLKYLKDDKKEGTEKRDKEHRVEFISLPTSYWILPLPHSVGPLFHFGMSQIWLHLEKSIDIMLIIF